MEEKIKDALKEGGIDFGQVVEVDPVENDYLVTGVKERESVKVRKSAVQMEGHTVPQGKSIIRRLEDLADSDFNRYMTENVGTKERNDFRMEHLNSKVEGICECLGVMKNTSRGVEYEDVLNRYQNEITTGDARIGEVK